MYKTCRSIAVIVSAIGTPEWGVEYAGRDEVLAGGATTATTGLQAQIEAPFEVFMGDGAFDGETVSNAVLAKQPEAQVVVPPHKTAVYSQAGDTQRDEHIRAIAAHGRLAWQKQNDYGLRSRVELAIQRYKRILGNCMKARFATTEDRSVVQCVRTEHDDKPWDASVSENLKCVGKRARFSQISIYSTTPLKEAPAGLFAQRQCRTRGLCTLTKPNTVLI
jgi:hypothetical protein